MRCECGCVQLKHSRMVGRCSACECTEFEPHDYHPSGELSDLCKEIVHASFARLATRRRGG